MLPRVGPVGACLEDINAAALELTIRIQRVQIGWEVEGGQPKIDAGERGVVLDTGTLHRRP